VVHLERARVVAAIGVDQAERVVALRFAHAVTGGRVRLGRLLRELARQVISSEIAVRDREVVQRLGRVQGVARLARERQRVPRYLTRPLRLFVGDALRLGVERGGGPWLIPGSPGKAQPGKSQDEHDDRHW
jgi:hypothetical protein